LLTLLALKPLELSQIPLLLGAFSFAWLLGLIVPGAPGGLVSLKQPRSHLSQSFSPGLVISAIALYRLVSILAEAAGAGLAWLTKILLKAFSGFVLSTPAQMKVTNMDQENRQEATVTPPVAQKLPQVLILHGDQRWTNTSGCVSQRSRSHRPGSKTHTSAMTQHTEVLQTTLYEEARSHQRNRPFSPIPQSDYYYYSRTESGKAKSTVAKRPRRLRRSTTRSNELAQGHEYFSLGVFEVSPNHQLLAYSVDTSGAEQYTLFS